LRNYLEERQGRALDSEEFDDFRQLVAVVQMTLGQLPEVVPDLDVRFGSGRPSTDAPKCGDHAWLGLKTISLPCNRGCQRCCRQEEVPDRGEDAVVLAGVHVDSDCAQEE
jgi:hypothetical protein